MEILGIWKLKAMIWLGKGGFRMMSDIEISEMEDSDANKNFKRMLAADFIVSETSLDIFYRPHKGEEGLADEKGWKVTDRGLLMESFPCKIEDGVLYLDYLKKGAEYSPTWIDEEGVLSLSGGLIKIKKV